MTHAVQGDTRQRLLEAAGAVFGERGYDRATVRTICGRAGTNVGAVNYHFQDKDTLYREVLRYAFEQTEAEHPMPALDGSVPQRLQAFVRTFLARLFRVNRSWYGRVMARELADPSPILQELVETRMRPVFQLLEGIIEQARPDLTADQRRLHAMSLIGQCVFFRHARPILDILFGPEAFADADIPRLTRHITGVFLRGLGVEELP